MIEMRPIAPVAMTVVDTRGLEWPTPLIQLSRAVLCGRVGDTIGLRLTDRDCLTEIVEWVSASGHGLVALSEWHGYDEVIVEVRQ